jgi:hypothetical protein
VGVDAFVIRQERSGTEFAAAFLASPDFDKDTIDVIARQFSVGRKGSRKADLIHGIISILKSANASAAAGVIIEKLISRKRDWVSVQMGAVLSRPVCSSASQLVTNIGEEKWYGPLHCYVDDSDAEWYIRPVLVDHIEVMEGEHPKAERVQIRWLVFARVTNDTISLHWQGFSHLRLREDTTMDTLYSSKPQFPYWQYIPKLFTEIKEVTCADVRDIELHDLILNKLWDYYIGRPHYKWDDKRIRAQSGGVALSAHASSSIIELSPTGILSLAQTIRKAVEKDLLDIHGMVLPGPSHFDDVIRGTLIKGFGPLSYGFDLEREGTPLLSGHAYFGFKPDTNSPDCFQHLRMLVSRRHNFEQLSFLRDHLKGIVPHEDLKSRTLPLF